MAHDINGAANFTNGLDKKSVMHFDKKMLWMLKMTMIHEWIKDIKMHGHGIKCRGKSYQTNDDDMRHFCTSKEC